MVGSLHCRLHVITAAWFVNELQVYVCVCVCVCMCMCVCEHFLGGGGRGNKSSAWILYMWLTGLDLQA